MKTLGPAHTARVEYADAHGNTGAEGYAAITRAIAQRERRQAGSTAAIDRWRVRRMPGGELIAEPQLSVAAALLRMRQRRLRDQKAEF